MEYKTKQRNSYQLILLLFLVMIMYSCEHGTTNDPRQILGRQLIIPKEGQWIIHNRDTIIGYNNRPKIVIYIGLKDCSMCQLRKLKDWTVINEIISAGENFNDSLNVDLIFIINADKNNPDFRLNFNSLGLKFPVMCDANGDFAKNNMLHKDEIFNCFLIDQTQKVILIGHPIYISGLWRKYKEHIYQINKVF